MSFKSSNATITGAYPWIAALGYRDDVNPSSLKFLCAGSLISLLHILTSAHCINQYLSLVRLGAHNLSKATENGIQDYRIKRTAVHESFDMKSISNDIALIMLERPVSLTGNLKTNISFKYLLFNNTTFQILFL